MGKRPAFLFNMRREGIKDKLSALVSPEISGMGLDLVELSFSGGLLRITIDKPGGVKMDDCVAVNKRVSMLLDAEDPIDGSYRLEVTSPGLNRRLRTTEDFEYFKGRKVKILTDDCCYRGILKGLFGETVRIDTDGSEVSLLFKDIKKANLDFDF